MDKRYWGYVWKNGNLQYTPIVDDVNLAKWQPPGWPSKYRSQKYINKFLHITECKKLTTKRLLAYFKSIRNLNIDFHFNRYVDEIRNILSEREHVEK